MAGDRTRKGHFLVQCWGYATTSHAAQGKTVDRGILIMGEAGIRAANLQQAYVSNSRFRQRQTIYTTNLKATKDAMANDLDRKLAHELHEKRVRQWRVIEGLVAGKGDRHIFGLKMPVPFFLFSFG